MEHSKILKMKFILLALLFVCFSVAPLLAVTVRVIDEAELLSEADRLTIEQKLERVANDLNVDVLIITKKSLQDSQHRHIRQYLEDYFYKNNRGAAGNAGVILGMDMQQRDIFISTFGAARRVYDSRTDMMRDYITPDLSNGRYFEAFSKFAIVMRPPGFFSRLSMTVFSGIPLIVALVLTLITVGVLCINFRGKNLVNSNTYAAPGAFQLTSSEDRYIRTEVRKSKIQKSSSGRSSGGRGRSGGSGGKF